MGDNDFNSIYKVQLTQKEFDKLSQFITSEYGIKLPPEKKIMLQSRLQRRLKALGITDYKKYIEYVFSDEGKKQELIHMIDVVTTNKTDFFRENKHFEVLLDRLLPEMQQGQRYQKQLKAWSAGCSSGEEPYTLAMVLSEFGINHPGFDFSILATDISYQMLNKGAEAIYPEDKVNIIPMSLKKRYLLRSKDRNQKTVRIAPQLRQKITFKRHNLMDQHYNINETFDLVFCRNVLIYFYRENQEKIINKLCERLRPGGYFFLGHSESILNLNVPLKQIESTIYKRV